MRVRVRVWAYIPKNLRGEGTGEGTGKDTGTGTVTGTSITQPVSKRNLVKPFYTRQRMQKVLLSCKKTHSVPVMAAKAKHSPVRVT